GVAGERVGIALRAHVGGNEDEREDTHDGRAGTPPLRRGRSSTTFHDSSLPRATVAAPRRAHSAAPWISNRRRRPTPASVARLIRDVHPTQGAEKSADPARRLTGAANVLHRAAMGPRRPPAPPPPPPP